jgi:6-carboxyhexanoate--CoA ligase
MEKVWNIRMRASKKAINRKEIHISGAEGLYPVSDIRRILWRYIERALHHSKGKPDQIILTVEEVRQKPLNITTQPLRTVSSRSLSEGRRVSRNLLQALGISPKAIDAAFSILQKGNMRGAALISSETGRRLEHDHARGVRVSRLGIGRPAFKALSLKLSRLGINTDTVKEALILASKVASCAGVIAELCISDDPHYTTGYVASTQFGYVRIPHVKQRGRKAGGRVFFVREGSDIDKMIQYLEKTPVLVARIASCKGTQSSEEILDNSDL